MPHSTFEKFLPAAGTLAGILFAVAGYIAKTPESGENAVAVMTGHETRNLTALIATALFVVAMAFFAVGIRQALRSGEPRESTYSSAAFAGGIMVAIASALNAWVLGGLLESVDKEDAASARFLGVLGTVSWIPFMAAAAVLLLSTGIGGLRTDVLPKWLAIVTIVLGVCCLLGPTGFAVWFAMPVWCVAVSVVLVRRQSQSVGSPTLGQTTSV